MLPGGGEVVIFGNVSVRPLSIASRERHVNGLTFIQGGLDIRILGRLLDLGREADLERKKQRQDYAAKDHER